MSVRQSLLAILAEGEQYGYQLRHEFEVRTGRTWPINIGQVYTTLNRLVRDGLVEEAKRQDDGSVTYRLTYAGREEVDKWWGTAVDRASPGRDEVAIKIALAVAAPGVDALAVIAHQRSETLRVLQLYTKEKRSLPGSPEGEGLSRLLVLDHLIFVTEAEARWLELVEQRLRAR
ncbi:PadR family transcriptional regulator [Kineosporia succinea]|uniref:DNA-binding PadR family transcriptional regulator n=1 Tax=Kineosporia succinea TaxID=84632 RepID=A0ABT9P1S5_9ACTN|nr:PadR family transcriptional regulator [Kineosporia succinea]MDP9826631.1 DNA-binding PadR family transcriptional regulator [Kineosporia succinea]